ncbi:phosphate uptake regulator PhoU [Candidatus Woesearchaeota archaeon]|nr:phosphate uptake regulator PhoU [Candidatus Woesearchaeota archaeon]
MATPRKIIQLGEDTLVVSLPSAWTRQHKLKKGDELEAEEQGPRLVLYPNSEAVPGKVSVDVSGTEPVTKRILGALYKAGYDEIEITFGSPKELETIRNTIRDSFVGFEVVSKTKQAVAAKNVSQPKYEEFDTLIRRVFLLLVEFGEECYKAVASGDYAKILAVASLDEDINRHVNFCRRTLNTLGHKVVGRVAPNYHLVEQLERVGDCYKRLCVVTAESEPASKRWLNDLLADTNFFVRKFYELYYKFSLAGVAEFWREKDKLEKSVAASFELAGKRELPVVLAISEIIDNVAGANGALLTARL